MPGSGKGHGNLLLENRAAEALSLIEAGVFKAKVQTRTMKAN